MSSRTAFGGRLLLMATVAAAAGTSAPAGPRAAGYSAVATTRSRDTLRIRMVERASRGKALARGAVVHGYLSPRGLPPVKGQVTVTDSGLIFRSADGPGRRWRAKTITLLYIDGTNRRPAYVFRVDGGVFETDLPGQLLEVAAHPLWLDGLALTEWPLDRPLVSPTDTAAIWATARSIMATGYADSLYSLFGAPRAPVGLIGRGGRAAGRLGEYIGSRDSLALDPARMTGTPQLRHTLAHELGHRWQARSRAQVQALWTGISPIRDPKRYGYGNVSEHQAEAIAFAVDFLQTTARRSEPVASSVTLLEHYELLVPGTRILVRYLAMQPIYHSHPLAGLLTTEPTAE